MLSDFAPHATIPVSDLERARRFYADTLGFEAQSENDAGTFFGSGSGRFFIFKSSGAASGSHAQLGWEVGDIESEVRTLQQRGLVFEEYDFPGLKTENGIATIPAGRSAWFRDSEGNLLGLFEPAE